MIRQLSVVVVMAFLGTVTAVAPKRSWDTVGTQAFFHSCNWTGMYSEASLDVIQKFTTVTIEKGQGYSMGTPPYAEYKIPAQLKAIHDRNSSISTVMYMNSIRNWRFYELANIVEADPSLLLHDNKGGLVRITADPNFDPPKDGILVFNHGNPAMRQLWKETCLNATKLPYVSGCFSDSSQNHSSLWVKANVNATARQAQELGVIQTMSEVTEALEKTTGGPLIGKIPGQKGVKAIQIEVFTNTNASITEHLQGVADGLLVQVHWEGTTCSGSDYESVLAAYLVSAGPKSYFGHGKWSTSSEADVASRWCPSFDLPLGKPLADAVLQRDVWSRKFASGTSVTFNIRTRKGSIDWASSAGQA